MSESEIEITIGPFVDAMDELRIPYLIGGSVAGSVFGIARSTMDVDMVAAVTLSYVAPLAKKLESVYYVSEAAVKEAVERNSSFNLVHLETIMKIDVFILKGRSFDQEAFRRRRKDKLDSESSQRMYYISSPEDIIINKLECYLKGGLKSERQWNDIIGILKVQGSSLDLMYCEKWAKQLAVGGLLEKALQDARA